MGCIYCGEPSHGGSFCYSCEEREQRAWDERQREREQEEQEPEPTLEQIKDRHLALLREVVKAADALRQQMDQVYEHPAYKTVWQSAKNHGYDYPKMGGGADWIAEQEAFDAARARAEKEGAMG